MRSTPLLSDRSHGVVYDGRSARAQPVTIDVATTTLIVTAPGGVAETIDRAVLRQGSRGAAVHRRDQPDWRLRIAGPVPPWVARLPDVGRLSPAATRIYVAAIGATLALVATITLFGDDLLAAAAPLLPSQVTRPIGDAVIASLGAPRCSGATGTAALARLVARLRPAAGFVEPVEVTVVDTPAINAVTAPGGRVAMFHGLIAHAAGPDEVAGVLAHELTHVALRHPAKALLREAGLSLIVRAIGGDVGNAVDLAGTLRSSRRAERAADAGALVLLRAAHVSPAGLAAFFDRMQRDEAAKAAGDRTRRAIDLATSFAATHPGEAERAAAITTAIPRAGATTPAMAAADWQALRSICVRHG